jgi:hypothetical protein
MSDAKSLMNELVSSLKRQRDELALQMHLGKAEAKDEYDKARRKLDKLIDDYEPVKDAIGESTENVLESMKLVGEEILQSFRRVRDSF